jgi:hypothetical protein
VDPAAQAPDIVESRPIQELRSLQAPGTHLAQGYDLPLGVQFMEPFGQLGEWYQLAADIRNLVLGLIADIKQEKILTGIQPLLQLFNSDFTNTHCILPIRISPTQTL